MLFLIVIMRIVVIYIFCAIEHPSQKLVTVKTHDFQNDGHQNNNLIIIVIGMFSGILIFIIVTTRIFKNDFEKETYFIPKIIHYILEYEKEKDIFYLSFERSVLRIEMDLNNHQELIASHV